MAFRNVCREIAPSKPLFLTVYTVFIIGAVVSFFYVFSAVYSSKLTADSSAWFSSHSSFPSFLRRTTNFSQSNEGHAVPTPALGPQGVRQGPPHNKKKPPLEDFRLTKELVQKWVKDNIIIVTFGNYAYMDFILNWVKHLTDLGLSNFLVGAMDLKLLKALYWEGVPVFDMGHHRMSTEDVGWGSRKFYRIGREKNPLPYIARYPDADVLTSSDEVAPTVIDDSLEIWQEVNEAYNIGIFYWRPTESAKKLAREWMEMLLADDNIWDQDAFNDIVHRQLGPSLDEASGLVYAFDGNLKFGIFPASIFCIGHTYFVQATHQQLRLEPYALHLTFQYGGTDGKWHRLREAMLFYDQPEYYNPPGGFLLFKPHIPSSLLLSGKHTIDSHFSLVNYQIKQIRTALAIASLLRRTLVMPPLWCRLDRLWFPHCGILNRPMTKQPFLCPLDHVFEVNAMLKELPEEEFGPRINIREYSILDNPSLPEEVKKSWLDVHLCQEGKHGCNASSDSAVGGVLRLPRNSNEETFIKVFSAFKDVKVIRFSSMQNAFAGFSDKAREDRFRRRVKRYVGIWCCVFDHIPSHIYYDMYWDEKPGWKPIPPATKEDDHPPW